MFQNHFDETVFVVSGHGLDINDAPKDLLILENLFDGPFHEDSLLTRLAKSSRLLSESEVDVFVDYLNSALLQVNVNILSTSLAFLTSEIVYLSVYSNQSISRSEITNFSEIHRRESSILRICSCYCSKMLFFIPH